MDDPARKRPSPARDSLDILRRVEPVLLRLATDVVGLRQTAGDPAAVSAAVPAVLPAADDGVRQELATAVHRLTQSLEHVAVDHDRLLHVLELVCEGQERITETQDRLGLEQGRLVQGWARQEDGHDRLQGGQVQMLDGLERLHRRLEDHAGETDTAHESLAVLLQRLRQVQVRAVGDQELILEGQKTLGRMIVQLDERARQQAAELRSMRRDLRFLPVLWSLAALVFALSGAAIVLLRWRLS